MPNSNVFNMDCLEYMKTVPDKYYDLLIADTPYGGGADTKAFAEEEKGAHFVGRGRSKKYAEILNGSSQSVPERELPEGLQGGNGEYHGAVVGRFGGHFAKYHLGEEIKSARTGGTWASKYGKDIRSWDVAPTEEYFNEMARISKNQIIWGGNYFDLPPTRCFLVWRKLTISETFTMAMCEYAWTSFNDNAKWFEYPPQDPKRFHPTAKPRALYDWIFRLYGKLGMKVFDPYLGQGNVRIAAYEAGCDFDGCELDETYFKLHEKMWDDYISQLSLFNTFTQEELNI